MRNVFKYILALSLCSAFFSCSVVENRDDCFCIVKLDMSAAKAKIPTELQSGILECSVYDKSNNRVLYDTISMENVYQTHELSLPRGLYTISAVVIGEYSDYTRSDTAIIGKIGTQTEMIYAARIPVNTDCEELDVPVTLHKHYSNVTVRTSSSRPTSEMVLEVNGNYNGLNLTTLKAAMAPFMCTGIPDEPDYRTWSLVIPRQGSTDISLRVCDARDMAEITVIPLGQWLEQKGYDLTAEDLDDYTVTIDVYAGTVEVSVVEWDEENINEKY